MEEGLRHSGHPCARGLSVAGLLDGSGPFPGSGWFILEVKRDTFCTGEALPVDVPNETVNGTALMMSK